jgi:SAM-dependent methyltransferase
MKSQYHHSAHIEREVAEGRHREVVGGLWEEVGDLQLRFLIGQGLMPRHRLLDIGCGSLRLGVRAVRYLEPGFYVGTDLNPSLLEAGYRREIVDGGLADRLPRANLVPDDQFAFPGIDGPFEMAIAQSVFTHLPLNDLLLCIRSLATRRFCRRLFLTVFVAKDRDAWSAPLAQRGGKVSFPAADPYHCHIDDLRYCAEAGGAASFHAIGDWGHPRGQEIHRVDFHV